MIVMNRSQFRNHWDSRLTGRGGALWCLERHRGIRSRYFIMIKPVAEEVENFWCWCDQHCAGSVLCYSSSKEQGQEWYGFTHRRDIVLFMLRWS